MNDLVITAGLLTLLTVLWLGWRGLVLLAKGKILSGLARLLPLGLVVAGVLILPTVVSIYFPHSPKNSCLNNLKLIGLACRMYSPNQKEAFPPSFLAMREYVGSNNVSLFVCPSSKHKPGTFDTVDLWADYVLVTNLTEASSPDTVLAYCKPGNHGGSGINVVFVDDHVEWVLPADYGKLSCDVLHLARVSKAPVQPTGVSSNRADAAR